MNRGGEFGIRESMGFYFVMLTRIASFLVCATLFAYGFITVYYQAYFAEFGVDISSIPFWPSLYDLAIWGPVSLMVLFVALLISLLTNRLAAKGTRRISRIKYMHWLDPGDSKSRPKSYEQIALVVIFCVISFYCVYGAGERTGKNHAKNQKQFTVITTESSKEKKKILLYQNANNGVFVEYDTTSKSFGKVYEIRELSGLTYRIEDLDR